MKIPQVNKVKESREEVFNRELRHRWSEARDPIDMRPMTWSGVNVARDFGPTWALPVHVATSHMWMQTPARTRCKLVLYPIPKTERAITGLTVFLSLPAPSYFALLSP